MDFFDFHVFFVYYIGFQYFRKACLFVTFFCSGWILIFYFLTMLLHDLSTVEGVDHLIELRIRTRFVFSDPRFSWSRNQRAPAPFRLVTGRARPSTHLLSPMAVSLWRLSEIALSHNRTRS